VKPLQRSYLTEIVVIIYHINHDSAKKTTSTVRDLLGELFAVAGYLQADIVAGDGNAAAYNYFKPAQQPFPSILQGCVHVAARTLESYFTDNGMRVGMHMLTNSPPETWTTPYDPEVTDFDCCLVHVFEYGHTLPKIQEVEPTASVVQPEFQVKLFTRPLQLDNPDLWLDPKDVSWHRPIMAYIKYSSEANYRKRTWARAPWSARKAYKDWSSGPSYKRPWETPQQWQQPQPERAVCQQCHQWRELSRNYCSQCWADWHEL
jgi:hypothetical protein